jgi:hypothetical protein
MKPLGNDDDVRIRSLSWTADDATNEALLRQATKCGYEGPRAVEEYMIDTIASILAGDEVDTEIYPGGRVESHDEFHERISITGRCRGTGKQGQPFERWAQAQSATA